MILRHHSQCLLILGLAAAPALSGCTDDYLSLWFELVDQTHRPLLEINATHAQEHVPELIEALERTQDEHRILVKGDDTINKIRDYVQQENPGKGGIAAVTLVYQGDLFEAWVGAD